MADMTAETPPQRVRRPRAGAVVIGDEVLAGKVCDENTPLLVRRLRERGIRLVEVRLVGDDVDAIAEAVDAVRRRADFAVTSGGIGPTHDDVTMKAIAKALGVPLERHPDIVELGRHAGEHRRAGFERMALVPRGTVLHWEAGRRAWPLIEVANIYVLPGVPRLFAARLEEVLRRHPAPPFYTAALRLTWRETQLAVVLAEVAREHPDVAIGSYPRTGGADAQPAWRVLVTFEGDAAQPVCRALTALRERLPVDAIAGVDPGNAAC